CDAEVRRVRPRGARTLLARWRARRARAEPRPSPSSGEVHSAGAHPGLALRARAALAATWEFPDDKADWRRPALQAALELAREHRPQAIYSTGPPHSVHGAALAMQRRTGLPLVIDFRDPWARNPWRQNGAGSRRQRLLQRLEADCIRQADAVILNTDALRQEFLEHYGEAFAEKLVVIPNGYDPQLLSNVERLLAMEELGRSPGVFRLCHSGKLYGGRDARPLVEALSLLRRRGRRVEFHQVGHCENADAVLEHARRVAVEDQVHLEGQVDHQTTLEHMAAADAFVVLQAGTAVQIPGKLFEMLMFRKPIIALTGPGATADVVQRYGLGAVAGPDDPQAIAAALQSICGASADQQCNSPGDARRVALEAFNGRTLTGRLAEILDHVSVTPRNELMK
ncbi:MAG: glycosyltransferase, partial [Planctomycetes bacterium]|nr:glycosyltransferase [Planctomycetota bacterium]